MTRRADGGATHVDVTMTVTVTPAIVLPGSSNAPDEPGSMRIDEPIAEAPLPECARVTGGTAPTGYVVDP